MFTLLRHTYDENKQNIAIYSTFPHRQIIPRGVSYRSGESLWDDCPYAKSNANTFVRARAYRDFLTLCVGTDLRYIPSIDPSTLSRKTLHELASLEYCYILHTQCKSVLRRRRAEQYPHLVFLRRAAVLAHPGVKKNTKWAVSSRTIRVSSLLSRPRCSKATLHWRRGGGRC